MTGQELMESTDLFTMAISPNWVTYNNRPGLPNITVMHTSNDKDLQFDPYFSTINDAKQYHEDLKKKWSSK